MGETVLSIFTDLPDLDMSFIDIETRFMRAKESGEMARLNDQLEKQAVEPLEALVRQMEAQT